MAGVEIPGAQPPVRAPDRCPGVLRPHQAADGAMVRIRVPGGQTTGAALARLSNLAVGHGSGLLQITSRASVQLRGLPDELPDSLVAAISEAGFLPSVDHERVRNIAASPLTGLDGAWADLRSMIAALDAALVAADELADLPGRFLFVLDDGRGDVRALTFDLGYRAVDPGRGVIMVGAAGDQRNVTAAEAVPTLIDYARQFLHDRGDSGAWRLRDLQASTHPSSGPTPLTTPLGQIGPHASVAVPLGHLTPQQVGVINRVTAGGPVVITPWRGLVLPGAARHLGELTDVGLIGDDASAWTMISACVGAPWCGNGRIDTRGLTAALVSQESSWPRTHVSGCEHRCGAPTGDHLDLVAPTRADALRARAGYLR